MESENKHWKPDAGKLAFILSWRSCISKVMIDSCKDTKDGLIVTFTDYDGIKGDCVIKSGERQILFPTRDAAWNFFNARKYNRENIL